MPRQTNLEHLLHSGLRCMSNLIYNMSEDYCAYCPRNRERRCNDDCAAGIREWLMQPFDRCSDVWKERRKP